MNTFYYDSVCQLVQELGISRMTFYRWETVKPLTTARMNSPLSYSKVTRDDVFYWLMNELYPGTHNYDFAVRAERFDRHFELGNQCI